MGLARRALLPLVLASFLVVGSPAAVAAPLPAGALNPLACVAHPSEADTLGCSSGHVTLAGIEDLAFGPGEQQLYVVAESDAGPPPATGSLVTYTRDAVTGALTRTDCRDIAASTGCVADPHLAEPDSIAISPGGTDLYVGDVDTGILHYRRAGDGTLSFQSCHEPLPDDDDGCAVADKGINAATGMELSPDGEFLYVSAYFSNAVTVYDRNPDTGALSFVECRASGGNPDGCGTVLVGTGLNSASDVTLSSDGAHVYVSARDGNSVVRLLRNPTTGLLGSSQITASNDFLDGPQTVAAAPGGEAVYAGLFDGDGLTTLSRDTSTGATTLLGCLRVVATAACSASPGVNAVFDLAFAPGGSPLYAAARNGSSLASFRRDSAGALTLASCSYDSTQPAAGCDHPVNGLEGVQALAASSDGRFVYAGGEDALVTLTPEREPACPALARTVPYGRPAEVQLACSDANGQPITYSLASNPNSGSATLLDAATGRLRYTPALDFAGTDTFMFTASDGTNTSAAAVATLTVPPDADEPRMRIVSRRVRLKRGGRARVKVRCLAGEPGGCSGSLSGRSARKLALGSAAAARKRFLRFGSKAFRIPDDLSRTVVLRLPRRTVRAVKQRRRLSVRLTARARDLAGNVGQTRRRVVVLAPKPR